MKWIQALKVWNTQSGELQAPHINLWAIPKKNTPSYEEVKDLMHPMTKEIEPKTMKMSLEPKPVIKKEEKSKELQELDDEKEEPVKASRGFLPDADRTFDIVEIARFGPDVPPSDMLGVTTADGKKDTYIGRWMSLAGRFPIPDAEDPTIVYPTIEHFLAGMKIKHVSNKPELAEKLMSSKGSIHHSFVIQRSGKDIKPESGEDFRLLMEEISMVRKTISTKTNLSKYRIVIRDTNEIAWNSMKDDFLTEALRYRFMKDVRFIKGVTAAKDLKKYLLYSTTAGMGGSELGGVRNITSRKILGENKVGRFLMKIADFKF